MHRYWDEVGGRINGEKQKKLLEASLKKQRETTRQLKGYEEPKRYHRDDEALYNASDH